MGQLLSYLLSPYPSTNLYEMQLQWGLKTSLQEGTLTDFSIKVPESIIQMGSGLHYRPLDRLHTDFKRRYYCTVQFRNYSLGSASAKSHCLLLCVYLIFRIGEKKIIHNHIWGI